MDNKTESLQVSTIILTTYCPKCERSHIIYYEKSSFATLDFTTEFLEKQQQNAGECHKCKTNLKVIHAMITMKNPYKFNKLKYRFSIKVTWTCTSCGTSIAVRKYEGQKLKYIRSYIRSKKAEMQLKGCDCKNPIIVPVYSNIKRKEHDNNTLTKGII